jgi:type III restriction enzyme
VKLYGLTPVASFLSRVSPWSETLYRPAERDWYMGKVRNYFEASRRLAKQIFLDLLKSKKMRFMVIGNDFNFQFPEKIKIKSVERLNKSTGELLQKSLFDYVPKEEFNEQEKLVALYLEDQDRLFFWYRNRAKNDYSIQGWQKQRIYPDFIFTTDGKNTVDKVYIVETKGIHLKNEDTAYKQSIFDLCNQIASKQSVGSLQLQLKNIPIEFKLIFGDEWQRKLNEIFQYEKQNFN